MLALWSASARAVVARATCDDVASLVAMRRSASRFSCFFFQAEDGIRDADVTGVQTCALPICTEYGFARQVKITAVLDDRTSDNFTNTLALQVITVNQAIHRCGQHVLIAGIGIHRSEERRVGKECRCRWSSCS